MFRSVITGSGSYIPTQTLANQDFSQQTFYCNGEQLRECIKEAPSGRVPEGAFLSGGTGGDGRNRLSAISLVLAH